MNLEQVLDRLSDLKLQCEQLAERGNLLGRQMAAADGHRLSRAIQSLRGHADVDSAAVAATLDALQPSNSMARATIADLSRQWKTEHGMEDEVDARDPDNLFERVVRDGTLVASEDWDSGAPGAGAGRVRVYLYEGVFYATHDAGLSGPFASKAKACDSVGI